MPHVDQRRLPLDGGDAFTTTGAGVTAYVAKGVPLVPVRVLGCDGTGTWSGVLAGIDWVASRPSGRAVVNTSLSGPPSAAVDEAVERAIDAGIPFVLAAGNGDASGVAQDACKVSHARVAEAITVSATDTRASFADYGRCVDWFAAGVGVLCGVAHRADGDAHRQRHVDGRAAHRRGGRAPAAGDARAVVGRPALGAARRDHQGRGAVGEAGQRPPAVHRPGRPGARLVDQGRAQEAVPRRPGADGMARKGHGARGCGQACCSHPRPVVGCEEGACRRCRTP